MNRKGVTLIELIIVVAILGILAVIAVPAYLGQTKSATRQEAFTNLQNLRLLEEQYFAENGEYTPSMGTCAKNNTGNVATIQGWLRGFQPGSGEVFSYCIEQNVDLANVAQTPCFRARAIGNSNTRVENEEYMIDCNNDRNF
jgi:prepilin-type N-terminal cleavage/methylation domain-containing protein